MSDETTPRTLKGNLLNARDRLGETIIEIVAADVAVHGEEVIAALRKQNPAAYARLISDLVHFKQLATERAPKKEPNKPQRKPRQVRMKELLRAMDDQPVDVNDPRLPPKHRERWLQAEEALRPRKSWDLTPEELREAWDADLAEWYERQVRKGRGRKRPSSARWNLVTVTRELRPGAEIKIRFRGRPRKRNPTGAKRHERGTRKDLG
jgi:hypothetical protein